jgi:hypothetical protein
MPNPAPNDDRPFDLSPTCRRRFPESLDLRPDRQCSRPHSECAHAIFCSPCFRTFLRAINRLDALHQALRLATVRVRVGSQSGATVGTLERWTAVHSLRARVGLDPGCVAKKTSRRFQRTNACHHPPRRPPARGPSTSDTEFVKFSIRCVQWFFDQH